MNVFSSITALTDVELQEDSAFWQKHGEFILSNPRGYGYWIWKSYLIQQKLLEIPDGDILLYADAGCELNPFAKRRFFELVTKTTARKFIGTHSISTDITYTKQDTIVKMGMADRIDLLAKNQIQAGCLMMPKMIGDCGFDRYLVPMGSRLSLDRWFAKRCAQFETFYWAPTWSISVQFAYETARPLQLLDGTRGQQNRKSHLVL